MEYLKTCEQEKVLELIEEHASFICGMAGKYADSQMTKADFMQEAMIVIIKAVIRTPRIRDRDAYIRHGIARRMQQVFKSSSFNLNMAPRCRREPRISIEVLQETEGFDVPSGCSPFDEAVREQLCDRIYEQISPFAGEVLDVMIDPDEKLQRIVIEDSYRMDLENLEKKSNGKLPMALTITLRQKHLARYFSVSKATLSRAVTEIRKVTSSLMEQEV